MDKAKLLGDRMPTETVAVAGGEVVVRALSRKAIHMLKPDTDDGDGLAVERRMVHFGMVDPALSEEEVEQWFNSAPQSEIQRVTDTISRLSGIGRFSEKEATKSAADEPEHLA